MKVFIYTNKLRMTANFRAYLVAELQTLLAHMGRTVNRVNLYFQDCNGEKGGVDKVCRAVLHLQRRPCIVIEDRDPQLAPLAARVLERLGQVTQRRQSRQRERSGAVSMSGQ